MGTEEMVNLVVHKADWKSLYLIRTLLNDL